MLSDPLDLIKFTLDDEITVFMKGDRQLNGTLYSYDQHLNMILGEVEEIAHKNDVRIRRKFDILFIRGDNIVTINPNISCLNKSI